MALLEQPTVETHTPITLEEAQKVVSTGIWGDNAALKLVVQDTLRAENYEATKQWVMGWPSATSLYQSPYTSRYWEGTQTERANVPFFTVAKAVNSLTPPIIKGLFYDSPPFVVEKRPGTSSQAARAIGEIINYQLEDINFRESLRLGINNALLFGTTIWKWGWETYTKERKIFKRKIAPTVIPGQNGAEDIHLDPDDDENIEEETIEETTSRPFFDHIVNLRQILVDPGLNVPDIQKAKFVIHRMYLTWDDLDKLRDRPGMNLPSRDKLLELFFPPREIAEQAQDENSFRNPQWDARAEARHLDTTEDPFNQPLEVLERVDEDRVITVLQKKLVICNEKNPYGCINFLSIGWWDVPEAFFSMGLAKTIGAEQRLQQGTINAWLDNVALNLNGVYTRVMGKSVPTQSIRISPGKIVNIENKDDFKVLDRLPAIPEAGQMVALSQQRVEQISGAGEAATQGVAGASGHSNLARTAAGANLLGAGATSGIEDFIEKLSNQVVIPFIYQVHELDRSLLPAKMIREILDKELEDAYFKDGGNMVELLNARVKFSILAAAKLMARRNMAQALPIMIQYINSEPIIQSLAIQGKKIDSEEILRMMFEVSDWKNYNDVIVDMTPEDQKRWQSTQPGAKAQVQQQGKMQLQQQQFDNKAQLIDQENIARAGREVLRQSIEQAATPEEITGQPGGRGFGSNV